jgi:hypothetical protein
MYDMANAYLDLYDELSTATNVALGFDDVAMVIVAFSQGPSRRLFVVCCLIIIVVLSAVVDVGVFLVYTLHFQTLKNCGHYLALPN